MAGPLLRDRVKETTTTTGTGSLTLAGAAAGGFRTFASALSVNDTCYYGIQHSSAGDWEAGIGTLSASATLARTTVLASSNGGAAVNFGAGTKDVFIAAPSSFVQPLTATGDILYQAADGKPTRLPIGTTNYVLTVSAGGLPVWAEASGAPFSDATALVKGSADATKQLRFEVDGFSPGVTRVLTPPDQDGTLAVLERAQTFVGTQTVQTGAAATKGLIVQGAASQSANLAEWQNSSATALLTVESSGKVVQTGDATGFNVGGGYGYFRKDSGASCTLRSGGVLMFVTDNGGQIELRSSTRVNGDTSGNIVFSASGTTSLTISQVSANTLFSLGTANSSIRVRGAASQPANLTEWQDSGGVVQLAIGPTGQLKTNQTAAATTPGSVVRRLPLYDAAGTLLGYVPIYDTIT